MITWLALLAHKWESARTRKEEALYPIYEYDSDGHPLDGSKASYILRFPRNGFPPVNAFWSLTMYNLPQQLLVKNPINRYLIKFPDASGPEAGSRWRPDNLYPNRLARQGWGSELVVPSFKCFVHARHALLLAPKQVLIDGQWKSPKVQRVSSPRDGDPPGANRGQPTKVLKKRLCLE